MSLTATALSPSDPFLAATELDSVWLRSLKFCHLQGLAIRRSLTDFRYLSASDRTFRDMISARPIRALFFGLGYYFPKIRVERLFVLGH